MAAATNAAGCFVFIMHESLTYVATVPSLSSSSSTATAPPPASPSMLADVMTKTLAPKAFMTVRRALMNLGRVFSYIRRDDIRP